MVFVVVKKRGKLTAEPKANQTRVISEIHGESREEIRRKFKAFRAAF